MYDEKQNYHRYDCLLCIFQLAFSTIYKMIPLFSIQKIVYKRYKRRE